MVNIACKGVTFSHIKAIFFDKDGTLEDSSLYLEQLAVERVNQIAAVVPGISDRLLRSMGITSSGINPKGLMAVGSRIENELAAAAYITESSNDWFYAKKIATQAFNRAANNVTPNCQNSPLFEGSLAVLQQLSAAKLKLGIISADSVGGIKSFVEREKLCRYFQLILGSDRNLSKPNPQLYLKACKMLDVHPSNTLMIGDAMGDIIMARQANAAGTIAISRYDSPRHLKAATVTIDRLAAIEVV